MTTTDGAGRRGHRLIQVGVALFLFALLIGIAIPAFPHPRLGLATHLLAITQGTFLIGLGLIWPRLTLGRAAGRAAFILILYGCLAALSANFLAGIWQAGNTLLPLAAGAARGTEMQETIIALGLRSGGAALIVSTALVLWGLRLREKK